MCVWVGVLFYLFILDWTIIRKRFPLIYIEKGNAWAAFSCWKPSVFCHFSISAVGALTKPVYNCPFERLCCEATACAVRFGELSTVFVHACLCLNFQVPVFRFWHKYPAWHFSLSRSVKIKPMTSMKSSLVDKHLLEYFSSCVTCYLPNSSILLFLLMYNVDTKKKKKPDRNLSSG